MLTRERFFMNIKLFELRAERPFAATFEFSKRYV